MKQSVRKKDLIPGMRVRNTVSGTTGVVLGDPRRAMSKLHPLAAPEFVRVSYRDRRRRRECAWWLKHVRLEK